MVEGKSQRLFDRASVIDDPVANCAVGARIDSATCL
jgi:hypothetical protein